MFLVADNLRGEMARRRILQSDLADLLGLSAQSMSRRLRGEVPFRDSELVKISERFDIDMPSLFRESA